MNVARIGSSSATNFKGVNAEKIFSKAANINSWQQRLALGVSAMAIQPAIDRLNNNVDPKTREMSAARSLAKGLVGMTTGIIVRGGCMKAVETSLKKDKMVDKLAKIVTKENTDAAISKTKDYIKQLDNGLTKCRHAVYLDRLTNKTRGRGRLGRWTRLAMN